jgi:glucose-6-phosphate 1-dehydrogenase
VEITSSESLGVEKRGGYYDNSGALRDMVQNHLLQLVGLIAMEPPILADSINIRNETLKVFKSIRPLSQEKIRTDVIRGQYLSSIINNEKVNSYRDEEGVRKDSKTETYAAMKFFIDNWRWSGVPFYVRTGKRLPTRVSEVVIHYKSTPHHLFCNNLGVPNDSNQLVIRIQPDEGLLMKFGMKVPGAGFTVQNVNMDFHYSSLTDKKIPEAYERLLLDCMLNDSTLYARGDAAETTWEFINPILEAWKEDSSIPLYGYPSGTWGPDVADSLIEEKWLKWRHPCKNLTNDGIYCEL